MRKASWFTALILVVGMAASAPSLANVPDAVITTLSSASGYATVGGKLTAKPKEPVGLSVQNGNILYSTVSDPDGRWAVVIRHISTQVTVNTWSLTNPAERSANVTATITSSLPWSRSVTASGSASSETSAKYQTETSLRWEIDRERSNCSYDKGAFSTYGGFVYCNRSGSTFQCSATASCVCNS